MRIRVPLLIVVVCIAALAVAQQPQKMTVPVIKNIQNDKFTSSASVPDCVSAAVERGDPRGNGSVRLVKFASDCTVPMHWHSSNSQDTLISGSAELQMPGEKTQALSAGGYIYMPAHHVHQYVCKTECTVRIITEGPVDIHYVDTAGNEITPEKAMAAFNEHPGGAVAAHK